MSISISVVIDIELVLFLKRTTTNRLGNGIIKCVCVYTCSYFCVYIYVCAFTCVHVCVSQRLMSDVILCHL